MHAMWRGDPLQTLIEELRSLDYAGFFAECWKLRRARDVSSPAGLDSTRA